MAEIERLLAGMQQNQQAQTNALITQLQQQMSEQGARHQESMRLHTEALATAVAKFDAARSSTSLVDSRGVAKPDVLNLKIAKDLATYKTWRLKFSNWICAALPGAAATLEHLEGHTETAITV